MPGTEETMLLMQEIQRINGGNMSGGIEEMRDSLGSNVQPKTKDQCVSAAFKAMTGKTLTNSDVELLKCLIAYWESK